MCARGSLWGALTVSFTSLCGVVIGIKRYSGSFNQLLCVWKGEKETAKAALVHFPANISSHGRPGLLCYLTFVTFKRGTPNRFCQKKKKKSVSVDRFICQVKTLGCETREKQKGVCVGGGLKDKWGRKKKEKSATETETWAIAKRHIKALPWCLFWMGTNGFWRQRIAAGRRKERTRETDRSMEPGSNPMTAQIFSSCVSKRNSRVW